MALRGLKVVELAGLAPAPFCGMILADFGADVIRVDKPSAMINSDTNCRNKKSIAIDMKREKGTSVFKTLCKNADVLIEPFRAGVMERLGLGPETLMSENPRLVYARLTGYGQTGPLAPRAGHDINYIAISGVLSRLGRQHEKPTPPINLLADFAGGGLTCALGIVMALLERERSGRGQVVDSSMVQGAAYLSSFLFNSREAAIWGEGRGTGWLDTGAHFYDTYATKDGEHMAVGAIEPQFYDQLIKGLGLPMEDAPQFGDFPGMKKKLSEVFATKTREEWCRVFDDKDACVTPVLSLDEAAQHPHNAATFVEGADGLSEPQAAPALSRTPAAVPPRSPRPDIGQHSAEVLAEAGYRKEEIEQLIEQGVVMQAGSKAKL